MWLTGFCTHTSLNLNHKDEHPGNTRFEIQFQKKKCQSSVSLQWVRWGVLKNPRVLMLILSRTHKHTDRRGRRVFRLGVLIKRVCAVYPEQRWDSRRSDVEDPGVCDLTVNLHHHLELFVPYDAVCNGRWRSTPSFTYTHINTTINKLSN